MKYYFTFFLLWTSFYINPLIAQNNSITIKNGIYETNFGSFTIGIEKGILTGFYEYYDQWDDQLHTYLRQDVFYIYGTLSGKNHFKVSCGINGFSDIVKGDLWFLSNNRMKIVLEDGAPGTGCGFDISQDSKESYFPLKTVLPIIGAGLVKFPKVPLYNYDGTLFIKRKGYLLKHNWVLIRERKSNYTKIGYKSLTTGKTTDYWINTSDIQISNINLWGDFLK